MSGIDPAQARLTRRVLWAVLLGSQGVYWVVLLSGVRTRSAPLDVPALPIALAAVALATAVGAHFAWRRATGAGRVLHEGAPDPAASFPMYVLAWVLDESIAVYALVLGFLGFPPTIWAAFGLAALALFLVHRPA